MSSISRSDIIRATTLDIPRIQQVAAETWPTTFREILSPEQIAYMMEMMYATESLRRQMEEQHHVFLLAIRTDAAEAVPTGYASYELRYQRTQKTKIHKLYIRPDVQRAGVGRVLLDTIREVALTAKQTAFTLNVNRQNPAIAFYERYGFTTVGQEDIPIGNGYTMDDLIMEYPFDQLPSMTETAG